MPSEGFIEELVISKKHTEISSSISTQVSRDKIRDDKARPSMESAGIDVFDLTTRLGWGINPIYRSVDPKEVNRALSVGIIFIH